MTQMVKFSKFPIKLISFSPPWGVTRKSIKIDPHTPALFKAKFVWRMGVKATGFSSQGRQCRNGYLLQKLLLRPCLLHEKLFQPIVYSIEGTLSIKHNLPNYLLLPVFDKD